MIPTHQHTRRVVPVLTRAAAVYIVLLAAPAAAAPPPKHEAPIPAATVALMWAKATAPAAPILMRVYKKEAELEVWKRSTSGRFVRLKTFPICRWSGQLGPKRQEGDRQAPEGFYTVTPAQMNPNSAHYLSFDTGFPNAYDRAQGATGSALMVHGTCSSAGCYAMTDEAMAELYALAREAFRGGQRAFQLQAYPFRMTAENLVRHRLDPHIAFWRQLKEGSDRFEATGQELAVTVLAGRYSFRSAKDLALEAQVQAYRAQEQDHGAVLLEEGRPAIRTTYADGGQHPSFVALSRRGVSLGEVSRPEALAVAGREIVLAAARPAWRADPVQEAQPEQLATGGAEAEARPESAFTTARQLSLFAPVRLGGSEPQGGSALPALTGSVSTLPGTLISAPAAAAL